MVKKWNPITGCSQISAGCANCYALDMTDRYCRMGKEKYKSCFDITLHYDVLSEPKKWRRARDIIVCPMSDLFHREVPFRFIDKVIDVTKSELLHSYRILTKRAERMERYFKTRTLEPNVWVGVTVENCDSKYRIDYLRNIRAVVRYVSFEPLLDDLGELNLENIDLVIVGGEIGNWAHPMKKEWILSIKEQAEKQGVVFNFNQWGAYGDDGIKRTPKLNGTLLDGIIYQDWPHTYENLIERFGKEKIYFYHKTASI